MLKREIKFKNFDDEDDSEIFYFNLTKKELIEMEVDVEGGLGRMLQRIIDEKDSKKVLAYFQKIILASYGVKSEDGRSFKKSEELSREFSEHAAYDALFSEFIVNPTAGAEFIEAIMPSDIEEFSKKLQDQDKPTGPPELSTNKGTDG